MGDVLTAYNPYTGKVIKTYKKTSELELNEFNLISEKAFENWKNTPLDKRISKLKKIIDLLQKNRQALIDAQISEIGMPKKEAEESFANLIHRLNTFFEIDESYFNTNQEYPNNINNVISRVPYGKVLIITPWNHPLTIPLWQIVPALLAGNVVLWKPSEKALSVNEIICDLFKQLDLPKGTFNMIVGDYVEAQHILDTYSINLVCFTGSLSGGKLLQIKCGEKMIPSIMELGGKDALIVCKDADIESATDATIVGSLRHSGQLCSSIERIFVHTSVYDGFISVLLSKTKEIKINNPENIDTVIACLKDKKSEKHIVAQVKNALSKGATILQGSTDPNLEFPLILTNVDIKSDLFQEETFGPIIAINTYSSEDELVKKVNDCKYGLCCTIWTKNRYV